MNRPSQSAEAVEFEHRLRTVYEMRDKLMTVHDCTEIQATEIAQLCVDTLAALTDEELIELKSAVNRMKRLRRDARIKAKLRTGTADQVAKEEGLSRRRVYEIAARRG